MLINPVVEQTKENSFISALIYAINYHKNKEVKAYSKKELETKIGSTLYNSINSQAENCILDLDETNFDEMCLTINEKLLEKGLYF